jgi:hypothetical protein
VLSSKTYAVFPIESENYLKCGLLNTIIYMAVISKPTRNVIAAKTAGFAKKK